MASTIVYVVIDTAIYSITDYLLHEMRWKDVASFVGLDLVYELLLRPTVAGIGMNISKYSTNKICGPWCSEKKNFIATQLVGKTLILGLASFGAQKIFFHHGNLMHELLKVFIASSGDELFNYLSTEDITTNVNAQIQPGNTN